MDDRTQNPRSGLAQERAGGTRTHNAEASGERNGAATPPPVAGTLIGSIVVTPPNPRPAQSVRVEVRAPGGQVLDGPDVRVLINGVPGAVRYLQFGQPGERRVKILAVSGGVAERQTRLVDVSGEPIRYMMARAQEQPAMLRTHQVPGQPHEVTLGLGMVPIGRRRGAREDRPAEASTPQPRPDARVSAIPRGENETQEPKEPALETSYEWDFGDGATAVTTAPTVNHDYFDAIDHVRGYGSFHVRCRARHSGLETIRTLTVYSAYAACRRLGAIVPRVRADAFAAKRYTMLSGTFTVHNVEELPLTLEKLSVTPLSDDPRALAVPARPVKLAKPIAIAPRSKSVICVNVPIAIGTPGLGELRYDAAGFSVLYLGEAGRLPVRVAATFEVRAGVRDGKPVRPSFAAKDDAVPWPWGQVARTLDERLAPGGRNVLPRSAVVIDPPTGTVAVSLARIKEGAERADVRKSVDRIFDAIFEPAAASDPSPVRANPRPTTPRKAGALARVASPQLAGPPAPGKVEAGQVCDPDNINDEDRERAEAGQLVCQRTDETIEVLMPARFMNARKGDVILSPGGPGLIGGLLRGTDPPQLYSHSGIMTRNYDEVTHSTASEERMVDRARGAVEGSRGFEPNALKYMWPGVIAQTVEDAVYGELFRDPEPDGKDPGKEYLVYSFEESVTGLTIDDEMVIIPPLVVKPDPLKETEAVRAALHAAATEARDCAGRPGVNSKGHYRLYCYTDPTIGETQVAPASAGWAAGTFGSVCSSFIWLMHRRRKAHFEAATAHPLPTDLEAGDVATGAGVDPGGLDGLYAYTAAERLAVAEWLFDTLHDQVRDQAGWLGEFLTDAANDVANQMINTFATDDADARNSQKWRDVGPATAVSPDNLLWWDGPDGDGLYGYAEPLIYREPRKETYTVSRWKQVLVNGSLSGQVTNDDGAPVAGALVQLYDGKSDYSDSAGRYAIEEVPFGKYEIDASKVIDGSLHAVQVAIDLQTADRVVNVRLAPPANVYRRAQIHLDAWGIDGDGLGKDDITNPGPEYWELELGPDKPTNDLHREYKWGGECRMEFDVECRLLVGNVLDVEVKGRLYEGTRETTDKLVGSRSVGFTVDPKETDSASLTVPTTDWTKKDEARLTLTVKNAVNTN